MREATKADRPTMGTSQAQCMIKGCYKMFSADGVAEQHKPYARAPEDMGKRGRVAERAACTDPAQLGMTPIERPDGVTVWGFITEEEYLNRLDRMDTARSARKRVSGA